MAQPICVMYVPKDFSFTDGGLIVRPLDLMKEFNGWGSEGRFEPRSPLGDYLWFCFFKEGITEPEFKTFYDKDFTPLNYDELKELVVKEWSASNGTDINLIQKLAGHSNIKTTQIYTHISHNLISKINSPLAAIAL